MKNLLTIFLITIVLLATFGQAGAAFAASAPEGYASAAAASTEQNCYYVTFDYEKLITSTPGSVAPINVGQHGPNDFVHNFGFKNSPFKARANNVECDTYITFYTPDDSITITSADDMRGKGRATFTGNYNYLLGTLRIHKVEGLQWEISKRLYEYLNEVQINDNYVASIAIYTAASDLQYPIAFPDAYKTAAYGPNGYGGTKLTYTLATTPNPDYIPSSDTGDFDIGDGDRPGGDSSHADSEASAVPTWLDIFLAKLAELLGVNPDKFALAIKYIAWLLLGFVVFALLILITVGFKRLSSKLSRG